MSRPDPKDIPPSIPAIPVPLEPVESPTPPEPEPIEERLKGINLDTIQVIYEKAATKFITTKSNA